VQPAPEALQQATVGEKSRLEKIEQSPK